MYTARTEVQPELYLTGYSFDEYLRYLLQSHPGLTSLLNPDRCRDVGQLIAEMDMASWEFEAENSGGRGLSYNNAQKDPNSRHSGMTALLRCLSPAADVPGSDFRILDVLGGDGTFARFCKSLPHETPTVYTADASRLMIDACRAQALPCVRQSATRSLFRDNVLDSVLIAYGSHHLGAAERPLAVREAFRTLKPGGRLVLHDFEEGGRCARWFAEVVHPYSRTGHPHAHFTRREMATLFGAAGFRDIGVFELPDPFTLRGATPNEARRNAAAHMYDMYDLIKIAGSTTDAATPIERCVAATLGPITVRREGGEFVARIPRRALVAVGTKPA